MEIPGAGWIIGIAGLIILLCVAYYCLNLLRNMATGQTADGISDHLADFRRLRDEGKLGEDEYERVTNSIPGQEINFEEDKPPPPGTDQST